MRVYHSITKTLGEPSLRVVKAKHIPCLAFIYHHAIIEEFGAFTVDAVKTVCERLIARGIRTTMFALDREGAWLEAIHAGSAPKIKEAGELMKIIREGAKAAGLGKVRVGLYNGCPTLNYSHLWNPKKRVAKIALANSLAAVADLIIENLYFLDLGPGYSVDDIAIRAQLNVSLAGQTELKRPVIGMLNCCRTDKPYPLVTEEEVDQAMIGLITGQAHAASLWCYTGLSPYFDAYSEQQLEQTRAMVLKAMVKRAKGDKA